MFPGINELVLKSDTFIWKIQRDVDRSSIKEDDFFYARGIKEGSTFIAKKVWFNIVNLSGVIKSKGEEKFTLKIQPNDEQSIELHNGTKFVKHEDELQSVSYGEVQDGHTAQVVGVWDELNKQVLASKVFVNQTSSTEQTLQ